MMRWGWLLVLVAANSSAADRAAQAKVHIACTADDTRTLNPIAGTEFPAPPVPPPEDYINFNDFRHKSTYQLPLKRYVVDCLTRNLGHRDIYGTTLMLWTPKSLNSGGGSHVALDEAIVNAVTDFRKRNDMTVNDCFVSTRLMGTLQKGTLDTRNVFVVERLDYLSPEGQPRWSAVRKEAYVPPSPKPVRPETAHDAVYVRLMNEASTLTGKLPLYVKLKGIDEVPCSARGDFRVHRLLIEQDYQGRPVKHLYAFIDYATAEKLQTKLTEDPKRFESPVAITLTVNRYDPTRDALVAIFSTLKAGDYMLNAAKMGDLTIRNGAPASEVVIHAAAIHGSPPPIEEELPVAPAVVPIADRSADLSTVMSIVIGLVVIGAAILVVLLLRSRRTNTYDD